MKKFFKNRRLKNARYLLEYCIVVLAIKILNIFDIERAASICSFIARKVGILLAINRIASRNIQMVFGNKMDTERIINQTWDNFGRFIGEFPHIKNMSEAQLLEKIEIIGIENIVEYKKSEQPFLLFSGHFANWDIALKLIHKFYPRFAVIYRRANNPYFNRLVNESRHSNNIRLIPKGPEGSRGLIQAIKNRESILMLVDQKMNDGIEVPFLGYPAMTPYAIARIALQYNYPIIPCQIIRTHNSSGGSTRNSYFKAIIHPKLEFKKTDNKKLDYYNIMLNINQILGEWVRQNPSQWFWFHNRWKK